MLRNHKDDSRVLQPGKIRLCTHSCHSWRECGHAETSGMLKPDTCPKQKGRRRDHAATPQDCSVAEGSHAGTAANLTRNRHRNFAFFLYDNKKVKDSRAFSCNVTVQALMFAVSFNSVPRLAEAS